MTNDRLSIKLSFLVTFALLMRIFGGLPALYLGFLVLYGYMWVLFMTGR